MHYQGKSLKSYTECFCDIWSKIRILRILPDVPLTDEHTGMVDALGKAKLEDLSLQPSLQEIFHFQAQNVIKLHLSLIQHSNTHQTPEQGVT